MGEVAAIRWENPLEKASFPLIVEDGEPRAVVVDIKIFRQLEALLDNLLATEAEAEDHFLGQSPILPGGRGLGQRKRPCGDGLEKAIARVCRLI